MGDPLSRVFSGLLTSILIWMDSYFILRYRPDSETVSWAEWRAAAIIGLLAAIFLAFFIPLVKGKATEA